MNKRVMIAAGGTGGHFYPGFTAALALRARGWEPIVVVKTGDPAKAKLEAADVACLEVDLRGMPRRPSPELFTFAVKLAGSLGLLSRAVRDVKPSLVLGMGGYLTFPLVFAAWRRGVPRAVHEANAILGLANRGAAGLGASLFWGLPPASGSGEVVGTPVRADLHDARDAASARKALGLDPARHVVLAFGGSQGAASLNAALPKALAGAGVQVLHLAGRGKGDAAQAAYREAKVDARALDYLEDMASAYAAADVVVCRSGASTLAELAAVRKPAILVPYPHATADHQAANARVFERGGACLLSPEGPAFAEGLKAALSEVLKSEERRAAMRAAYAGLGLPPAGAATDRLVAALERIAS